MTYLDISNYGYILCSHGYYSFWVLLEATFLLKISKYVGKKPATFQIFIVMKKLCFDYFVKGYSFDWKYNEIFRCVLIIIKFIRHLTALVTKVVMHFSMHCIFLSWLKIVIDSIDISCFDSIRLVLLNDLQIAKK